MIECLNLCNLEKNPTKIWGASPPLNTDVFEYYQLCSLANISNSSNIFSQYFIIHFFRRDTSIKECDFSTSSEFLLFKRLEIVGISHPLNNFIAKLKNSKWRLNSKIVKKNLILDTKVLFVQIANIYFHVLCFECKSNGCFFQNRDFSCWNKNRHNKEKTPSSNV
jgi:hypothetical protein